jgi:hypothetical protein
MHRLANRPRRVRHALIFIGAVVVLAAGLLAAVAVDAYGSASAGGSSGSCNPKRGGCTTTTTKRTTTSTTTVPTTTTTVPTTTTTVPTTTTTVPTTTTTVPTTTTGTTTTPTTTTTATTDPTTTTTTTTLPPPPPYLFDDEFDGAAGAPPDPSKWWATPWCSGSSDDSLGCFNPGNAFLNGQGEVVLRVSAGTMGRTYDFARIQTFQEGGWPPPKVLWSAAPPVRIEARAKFAGPFGGLWQSVWASGTNSPTPLELDVQEFRGALPTYDTCHVHGPVDEGTSFDTGVDLSGDYHVYWADYYADHAVFGVDGQTCGSFATPVQNEGIRLSGTIGPVGSWGGTGGPPPDSALPLDLLVDYVRVTPLP